MSKKVDACPCDGCSSYDGWDECRKYKRKLVWKILKKGAVIMKSDICLYHENELKRGKGSA